MKIIIELIGWIAWIVEFAAIAIASLFILRVLVAWLSNNPFGWLAYNLRRVTEPVIRPMRQPFSGYYMRFDLLPLVVGAMILFSGLFLADMISRIQSILSDVYGNLVYGKLTPGFGLSRTILVLGMLFEAAIFARVILPWFGVGYGSRFLRFLFRITEPLLRPLRRALSQVLSTSIFDFTPIIALLLVRVITGVAAQLVSNNIR